VANTIGVAVGPAETVGPVVAALCSLPDGPQPAAPMENTRMIVTAISVLINCFLFSVQGWINVVFTAGEWRNGRRPATVQGLGQSLWK
jgi:hypothetical protein